MTRRMLTQVARAAAEAQAAAEARDRAVRHAHARGCTLRDIAAADGRSAATIHRITTQGDPR